MPALASGKWIRRPDGLAEELSSTSVAVLAGGVTLYEACALGVPSVAVPLNERAARDDSGPGAPWRNSGRRLSRPIREAIDRVARAVERLIRDPASRRHMGAVGRRLIDARGAARVAARLRRLPRTSPENGHVA